MGRQVSFYMMPEDLAELESALKARGDVVFLANPMPGPDLREVDGLDRLPGDFGCRYLARREDLGKVQTAVVPATGELMLKASASPVVELSRSQIDERTGKLKTGRMWFTPPERGEAGSDAGADFVKWADTLLAYVRKGKTFTLLKDPAHKGTYISERARAWHEQGGELGA